MSGIKTQKAMKRLRALLPVALCVLMTACAFEPMYGKYSDKGVAPVGVLTERIDVAVTPEDPSRRIYAEQFKAQLENHLHPDGGSAPAAYRLDVILRIVEQPVAISRDGTVSRYNVVLAAQLILKRIHDGSLVYTSDVMRRSSYNNVSNAFYSTYVSSEDAMQRGVNALAEDVQLKLAGFFTQHPVPVALGKQEAPTPQPITMPQEPLKDINNNWK